MNRRKALHAGHAGAAGDELRGFAFEVHRLAYSFNGVGEAQCLDLSQRMLAAAEPAADDGDAVGHNEGAAGRDASDPMPGAQDVIFAPVNEVVYAALRAQANEQDITVGELSADVLAVITGNPGLVRRCEPEPIDLRSRLASAINAPVVHPDIGTRIRTEIRVSRLVYSAIGSCTGTRASDAEQVDQIAADLLAVATGHSWVIRRLARADMLCLAWFPVQEHCVGGSPD